MTARVSIADFKKRTKALKHEVRRRVQFEQFRGRGDVEYEGVLVVFSEVANPHVNEKSRLFGAMKKKPVKDAFARAFPCATAEEAARLQRVLQELVYDARTKAGLAQEAPVKDVDFAAARGVVETLITMLYNAIPEAMVKLRPQDDGRRTALETMRLSLEADPANLLRMAVVDALRAKLLAQANV